VEHQVRDNTASFGVFAPLISVVKLSASMIATRRAS
jgi:hypothetical protein